MIREGTKLVIIFVRTAIDLELSHLLGCRDNIDALSICGFELLCGNTVLVFVARTLYEDIVVSEVLTAIR